MPGTLPLLHPLDGPPYRPAGPATPGADPGEAITRFHHPNFQGVRTEGGRVTAFVFQPPLSGCEDRPTRPIDSHGLGLDPALAAFLNAEYEAALAQWSQARLRRAVRSQLTAAQRAWSQITTARAELDTVFNALRETPDGQWRAMTMRLVDAQQAAQAAAKTWDEVAGRLAKAQEFHDGDLTVSAYRLTVREVAGEAGVDVSAWPIGECRDYVDRQWPLPTRPMLREVSEAIDRQRQHLHEINDLVGRLADTPLHGEPH